MTNSDDAKKAAEAKKLADKKAAEKKAADAKAAEAKKLADKKAADAKKAAESAAKKPAGKKASLPDRTKRSASGSSKPRSTKLGAFQPLRGAFNAKTGTDEWAPYDPNSREFILLADAYNLGMRLLERPDATAKLVQLGHECVAHWKKEAAKSGYHWSGDEKKMTEYVNHFLEKYRSQCARLAVSSKPLDEAYAETVFELGYVLPDFFRLDPKVLTEVVVDKTVFGQVVENDAKRVKLFASGAQSGVKDMKAFAAARKECADLGLVHQALLGAVIFHEFAHCLVFYLGMDGQPNTPPDVKGLARGRAGESGAWLEKNVLGGVLIVKDNVLYLVDDQGQGKEVDMTKMKEFVNKPETFDLKSGLPLKANGRTLAVNNTRRSPSPTPDTRQRCIFKFSKKYTSAWDVDLRKDENDIAIHGTSPNAVPVAA